MRPKTMTLILMMLALAALVAACGTSGEPEADGAEGEEPADGENASSGEETVQDETRSEEEPAEEEASSEEETNSEEEASSEEEANSEEETEEQAAEVPEDKTLSLSVPKMDRVEDDEIPVAAYNDEQSLRDYTAIHLQGTGFPWQDEANVYVAGHRLGYPNTDSFLAFYDIDELEDGDEVIVTDTNGTEYVYEVFREIVVGPADVHVIEPMEGRNIISLQACTLPDYSQRIIVQAELKEELQRS